MPNTISLVTLIKGDTNFVESTEVLDGQILYDTEKGDIYVDDNGERKKYSGENVLSKISYIQETNVADRGYQKDNYITYNDTLYRVTRQINAGQTLIVGDNIEEANMGADMSNKIFKSDLTFDLRGNSLYIVKSY